MMFSTTLSQVTVFLKIEIGNYWVCVLCPSSIILKEHDMSAAACVRVLGRKGASSLLSFQFPYTLGRVQNTGIVCDLDCILGTRKNDLSLYALVLNVRYMLSLQQKN
jgi:hypothetical protein